MPSLPILPIPKLSNQSISSCRTFNGRSDLFLLFSTPSSSFTSPSTIRMGGGPRTFPGGVTKWQWKRMQAKKSKQLLKARLCRERQLYDMRKRAELKAAISELERPWEVAERAPVLYSISIDEQIKALADRFQRPSGFDMWSEKDGPRLFPKDAGSNQESYCSDSELVVAGSRKADEEEIDRQGGSHKWDSDHWGLDSRFERQKSHSYGSQSELAVNDSTMKRDKLVRMQRSHSELKEEDNEGEISNRSGYRNASASGYDRRSKNRGSNRSYSELALTDSRSRYRNASASGFDRRSENRGSNRLYSELALTDSRSRYRNSYGSESEIENAAFARRSGGDRNQRSSESYSRMQRQEMSSSFARRRGRGGTGGNRSSHRRHSQLEKEYNEGEIGNASAGGRGGHRNSYGWESEIENAGFRRGKKSEY